MFSNIKHSDEPDHIEAENAIASLICSIHLISQQCSLRTEQKTINSPTERKNLQHSGLFKVEPSISVDSGEPTVSIVDAISE